MPPGPTPVDYAPALPHHFQQEGLPLHGVHSQAQAGHALGGGILQTLCHGALEEPQQAAP